MAKVINTLTAAVRTLALLLSPWLAIAFITAVMYVIIYFGECLRNRIQW